MFGVRPGARKILTIGVIQGILIYTVRNIEKLLELPPFTHTLVLVSTLIIIIKLVTNIRIGIAISASLSAFLALIGGEILVFTFLYPMFDLSIEEVTAKTWLVLSLGYLGLLPLIITAFIFGKKGYSIRKSVNQ